MTLPISGNRPRLIAKTERIIASIEKRLEQKDLNRGTRQQLRKTLAYERYVLSHLQRGESYFDAPGWNAHYGRVGPGSSGTPRGSYGSHSSSTVSSMPSLTQIRVNEMMNTVLDNLG
jgi:hypothetical protein